jgi:UDP-N-acetylglucosamine 2-epimerase (non-hydrolysing)/UDP-GlcNAc3NAcA epimerase
MIATMKILSVVGARPQFVKLAPVSAAITENGHEHVIVHTGQHYDPALSAVFFAELGIPAPDVQLGVGSGGHGAQTGAMLEALDPVLARYAPDWVLVYGDTNSTLAGAVSAVKQQFPVAHLEAGLRSFNRRMPEEHNRVLTDHAADLLLVPSQNAAANLAREGVAGHVEIVGDVMVDVARLLAPRAAADDAPLHEAGVSAGGYVLATAHRAGTVDDPRRLAALVDLLLGVDAPLVLPLHPRTRARLEEAGLLERLARGTILRPPLGYLAFTALLTRARAVLTDSGGVQKEAYLAGVPCVTLRDSTEWVETVETGWNVLVDLDAAAARAALARTAPEDRPELYGDGHAGARVVAAMARLQRS